MKKLENWKRLIVWLLLLGMVVPFIVGLLSAR